MNKKYLCHFNFLTTFKNDWYKVSDKYAVISISKNDYSINESTNLYTFSKENMDYNVSDMIITTTEPMSENDMVLYKGFYGYNLANVTDEYYFNIIDEHTLKVKKDFLYNTQLLGDSLRISVIKYYDEIYDDVQYNGVTINCLNYMHNIDIKFKGTNLVKLPNEIGDYEVICLLKEGVNIIPDEFFKTYTQGEIIGSVKSSLTEIKIPNGITTIGKYAFYNNDILSSITIPNSVTSIGEYAFYSCKSLQSIKIPNSVTSIGDSAFSYCPLIDEIILPNSVETLEESVFHSCDIITSITLSNNITTINKGAFSYCSSLSSIEIPDSVTSIGNDTFRHCNILNKLKLSNNLKSIGDSVFEECYSLKSIVIPSEVETIGSEMFKKCESLKKIIFLPKTPPEKISNKQLFGLLPLNGILYYPKGCDYGYWLSDYYFKYYKWVGVELQDSYKFKVNFITNGVRVDSPYLTLTINGINGIKQDDNSYLFSGLQPVDDNYEFDLLGDGKVIDIVDISMFNKWIVVGDNSTMLTCKYIPCLETNIYSGNNLSYTDAYVDGEYVGKLTSSYTFNNLGEHIIQYNGVTSIGATAFASCYSLSDVTIPNSVTSISNYAFSACTRLETVKLHNNITSIGTGTFSRCYSLQSIEIPDSVTSISDYAFSDCYSLQSIEIPSSVTSIGDSAFSDCYSLQSIEIPSSVTSIGDRTFSYCYLLNEVTFEKGTKLKVMPHRMFISCYSLKTITIPESIVEIQGEVFLYCYQLNEIICSSNTPPMIYTNTFDSVSLSGIVYYPGIESYNNWKLNLPLKWDFVPLYIPKECTNLVITAENVRGRDTSTIISYTATTNGVDNNGNIVTNITLTGSSMSEAFTQNTSYTDEIVRTITFEYMGVTASTTIIQNALTNNFYEINLNEQWRLSTETSNPDFKLYDGVYESFSNKGVNNSAAICTITIHEYDNFSIYVRSNGENYYDYVVVSNLDCTLSNDTTSGTSVKMTTEGNSQGGSAITNYTLVEFSGIGGGVHTIQVMYRKDSGGASGNDQGYLLIPKDQ